MKSLPGSRASLEHKIEINKTRINRLRGRLIFTVFMLVISLVDFVSWGYVALNATIEVPIWLWIVIVAFFVVAVASIYTLKSYIPDYRKARRHRKDLLNQLTDFVRKDVSKWTN